VAAAKLADEAGLNVFGVGEHHRADYAVSAHTVVLGAIAAVTCNICLTNAVTILSSADPVRVFEDFATLDLLSSGRAELMAGCGAFVASFPLFGFALDDYEALYNEKLDLLLKLRDNERITWQGKFGPALEGVEVASRRAPPHPICQSGSAPVARPRAPCARLAVCGQPAGNCRQGSLPKSP
jgi:alkanesulfonate monooxygenase SsuD/methylene tetrahydromethanopterin reductase-like flavin-dependent oxidoreductase (luciferase family)